MKFLSDKIDLFSPKPELKIFGNPRFKTKLGVFIGSLFIISILAIYCFYLYECIGRISKVVIYNEKGNARPEISLNKKKFSFTVMDAFGKDFPEQDRLFSISAKYWKTDFVNVSKLNFEYLQNNNFGQIIDIPTKKCDKFVDKNFYDIFYELNLFKPKSVCIELDDFHEKLFGRYGSLEK